MCQKYVETKGDIVLFLVVLFSRLKIPCVREALQRSRINFVIFNLEQVDIAFEFRIPMNY